MKILLIILFLTITTSCATNKELYHVNKDVILVDEINNSIIDGFYDGDTIRAEKYLIKR